ncbi:MAG: site-specific DNA-methyltransferase [Candidatus Gracilibacteria bacterium]|nr:site-specific DNA-methyltransferase [Candidatus Gracilibacteria bacterium]
MSETKIADSTYEIQSHTVAEMKDLLIEMKGKNEDKKWQEKAQELEKELKSLKKNKNYGLFWKEKPEEFEKKTKDSFPVLEELSELAIKQDETPSNIIIEGDNYHTLSVLSYTHSGQVDVIYIDPPYNKGNEDFIYNDRYVDKEDDFRHSKWLSFMEKRLRLARNLLNDTGVIFISIDDNEQAQLKLLCDEIFGEENFIGNFSVENNPKGRKNSKFISISNEYCLVFAKDTNEAEFENVIPKDASDMVEDENGDYIRSSGKRVLVGENFLNSPINEFSSDKHYSVYYNQDKNDIITTKEHSLNEVDKNLIFSGYNRYITFRDNYFVENTYSEKKFLELFKDGRLSIRSDKIYEKHFSNLIQIKSMLTNKKYEAIVDNSPTTFELDIKTTSAKNNLFNLFGENIFDYPKNVSFIKILLKLNVLSKHNSLILDFFAGSGTTGHAVLELNKEDGGNRKFILCSNRESTNEFPDRNICRDITYERVKRVATGYTNMKGEQVEGLGGNIRYLRTDFIPKHKGTDNIRNRMVERCSEMLCLRENVWEPMKNLNTPEMRFYKRGDKYLAILFGLFRFEEFCQVLRTFDNPVAIYVFSRGQMTRDDFEGMIVPYMVEEIPDPILAVYKTIFGL